MTAQHDHMMFRIKPLYQSQLFCLNREEGQKSLTEIDLYRRQTVHKDGRQVSTSSHWTKMEPKCPGDKCVVLNR